MPRTPADGSAAAVAVSLLGRPGRAIARCPDRYAAAYPGHDVRRVVVVADGEPIWHGTLDLTRRLPHLRAMSRRLGASIELHPGDPTGPSALVVAPVRSIDPRDR